MALYSSYTDEQLLPLLQAGEEVAFAELYDRYWKKLLLKARLILYSAEDAEEVVHDIFVTLWKKRNTIVIQQSFQRYISAMLQYAAFRRLQQEKKHRTVETAASLPETADRNTQEWLDFEYLRAELEAAISHLPEKCQLIFRLSRETGLTDKEIAERTGLSITTIKTQKSRALQKLRGSLKVFFSF